MAPEASGSPTIRPAQLAGLFDNAVTAIIGMDREGRITLWNRQAERTFGWSPHEALGRTVASTIVPPRLREAHERGLRRYLASGQGRLVGSVVTVPGVRRDGTEISVELAISEPVRDGEARGELIAFARDVSERVHAERMRAMQLEVTRTLGGSRRLATAAPAILEAIATALEWPLGLLWMVDEEELALRQRASWQAPAADLSAFIDGGRELRLPPGAGFPGRVWAAKHPLSIGDIAGDPTAPRAPLAGRAGLHAAAGVPITRRGVVVGVIELLGPREVVLDDVTLAVLGSLGQQIGQLVENEQTTAALEHARDELISRAAELERSNTDLEQFARVASHDLQEPLRMVASYVQLLSRRYQGRLGADADEYIAFAVEGAKRMQALISDLLAYSRSDQAPHALTMVDTGRCVDAAISNLLAPIRESGANVRHGPLPAVRGNASQLTQLFQNLISNAIKFRGDRPPVVTVDARRQEDEWLFAVADNGIGIDPQHRDRVFEIFQRLHARNEYPGTGIGLALCRKVVERLGGRIWLDSLPGEGTTVHLALPAPTEPGPPERVPETAADELLSGAPSP